MSDIEVIERRVRRRIETARVEQMSNTKWRKLFAVIHSLPEQLGQVAIKFINDDRLFTGPIPGPEFERDDNFGECGGHSYARFTHIEFVQIPDKYNREVDGPRYSATEYTNDVAGLIERLTSIGSFPIRTYDEGIRILGYEWHTANGVDSSTE